MIRRNLRTAEDRAFWESAVRTATEVSAWPAWRRAGVNVADTRQENMMRLSNVTQRVHPSQVCPDLTELAQAAQAANPLGRLDEQLLNPLERAVADLVIGAIAYAARCGLNVEACVAARLRAQ